RPARPPRRGAGPPGAGALGPPRRAAPPRRRLPPAMARRAGPHLHPTGLAGRLPAARRGGRGAVVSDAPAGRRRDLTGTEAKRLHRTWRRRTTARLALLLDG